MRYQKGDRVRLIHTDDNVTRLRPGSEGVVRDHFYPEDRENEVIEVRWDDGSWLSMIPSSGDQIEPVR